MNPKELRIGNYFLDEVENYSKISGYILYELQKLENNKNYKTLAKKIKPIHLTEEWLVKLGFEWSIFHQAYHLNGFDYVIDFYENHPQTDCNLGFLKKGHRSGETLVCKKYVHQIQNIFFDLMDKELEIKNE